MRGVLPLRPRLSALPCLPRADPSARPRARRLVTTLGSFGVAAAAAGLAKEVRSPALWDFFYTQINFTKAATHPRTFRGGWETYPFELVWGDGWVGDSLWEREGSGTPPQPEADGMAAELARLREVVRFSIERFSKSLS